MQGSLSLLKRRKFGPLFATQFLNAFNDNFYKMAMVVLITFHVLKGGEAEEALYNGVASAIFIIPFIFLSAIAGQLADTLDKTFLIRLIKTAEIVIMLIGATGIWLENIPMMFIALFAMGVHSTFFGPIKYGILPQHLEKDEVLGGTGLVEAGTYIAILTGTIVGGILPARWAAIGIIGVAILGRAVAQFVPPAPPEADAPKEKPNWNIITGSWNLTRDVMRVKSLFMAVISISFFWAIGAILAAQFQPMVKNSIQGDPTVVTLFTSAFSIGIAVGSLAINRILKGKVSAAFAPASVLAMGVCVLILWWSVKNWVPVPIPAGDVDGLIDYKTFWATSQGDFVLLALFGISVTGGMFVVPLYAFLTTTVEKSQTARTIAANNIVNCTAMVLGTLLYGLLATAGISVANTLLLIAFSCPISAWISWKLYKTCG